MSLKNKIEKLDITTTTTANNPSFDDALKSHEKNTSCLLYSDCSLQEPSFKNNEENAAKYMLPPDPHVLQVMAKIASVVLTTLAVLMLWLFFF